MQVPEEVTGSEGTHQERQVWDLVLRRKREEEELGLGEAKEFLPPYQPAGSHVGELGSLCALWKLTGSFKEIDYFAFPEIYFEQNLLQTVHLLWPHY